MQKQMIWGENWVKISQWKILEENYLFVINLLQTFNIDIRSFHNDL